MNTKHTQGPWLTYGELITADDKLCPGYTLVVALTGSLSDNVKHPVEERQANARLIASAPAMAEELAILRADNLALLNALKSIAGLFGNIPLENLDGSCGPNEGRQRGILLRGALKVARELVTKYGPVQEQTLASQ